MYVQIYSIQNGLRNFYKDKQQPTMPVCVAILTTTGLQCTRQAWDFPDLPAHLHFCSSHHRVHTRRVERAGEQHQAGRCLSHNTVHTWCQYQAEENHVLCVHHNRIAVRAHMRQLDREERRQLIRETRENLFVEFGNQPWREMVDVLALRDDPNDVLYEAAMSLILLQGWTERFNFRVYWRWVEQGRIGPEPEMIAPGAPPPPPRELQNLAGDPQNVHTRVVSAQTNEAVDRLLTAEVPKEQQTEKAMVRAWTIHVASGWIDMLRTLNDVNKWFNTKTCRSNDDQLYRRVLRGLVATINRTDDEMRPELYKRLWEECRESIGMCCEGHISRLCNVLVGFDEAFQPQVSLGELIQQKMASIAGFDVSEDEKRRQATQWFDEHKVPEEQRQAWLDAF